MGVAGQSLRGLVGQGLSGRKQQAVRREPSTYPNPGTYTFVPTVEGYWKFVAWGHGGSGGGSGTHSGGSGAYVEITRYLTLAQTVTIVLPESATSSDTTVTMPDGTIAIAARANGQAGGVASGGDVNLNGSNGVSTGNNNGNAGVGTGGGAGGVGIVGPGSGGAGAPANLPYRGGDGGNSHAILGVGAGTGEAGGNGGSAFALAVYLGNRSDVG